MTARYALSLEARQNLHDIRQYYIEEQAPSAAQVVIAELTAAFRFIARNPSIGHTRADLTHVPVRFWTVYSYLIIYRPNVDEPQP